MDIILICVYYMSVLVWYMVAMWVCVCVVWYTVVLSGYVSYGYHVYIWDYVGMCLTYKYVYMCTWWVCVHCGYVYTVGMGMCTRWVCVHSGYVYMVGMGVWVCCIHVYGYVYTGCVSLPVSREVVLEYIVERKRMDDLASSIIDGRFSEQKVSMCIQVANTLMAAFLVELILVHMCGCLSASRCNLISDHHVMVWEWSHEYCYP